MTYGLVEVVTPGKNRLLLETKSVEALRAAWAKHAGKGLAIIQASKGNAKVLSIAEIKLLFERSIARERQAKFERDYRAQEAAEWREAIARFFDPNQPNPMLKSLRDTE